MSDSMAMAPEPAASELPRRFGFWTGTLVTLASMVGVGILTTSGFTLRDTQSPVTLLVLWTVGGILSLAGALTFAELATSRPLAGGEYVFVRDAFGRGTGFVYGWATLIFGFAGPTALIAYAMVDYALLPVQHRWGEGGRSWPSWITPALASLTIALLTGVHCRGQRQSSWLQNASTLFKLVVLAGFVIAGLAWGQGSWEHFSQGSALAGQPFGVLATSLLYVSYGYSGWNASVYLAGELRNPETLLPRCLVTGTLLVMLLYLSINVVYIYAIEADALANADPSQVQAIAETAGRRLWGPTASGTLSALIGLSILSSVSAYLMTGPRICFAMARDGLFPAYAGVIDPRWQTPVRAIITQGAFAIGLLWGSQIIAGQAKAFEQLLNYTTIGLVCLMALAVATIFVFRRREEQANGFRVPLYPFTPLLFLVMTGGLIVLKVFQSRGESLWAIGSLLSGWPIYWLLERRRRQPGAPRISA